MDRQAALWAIADDFLEAARAPGDWPAVLTRLADHLKAEGSQGLVFSRDGSRVHFGAVGRIDPAAQQEYERHYLALDFRRPRYLAYAPYTSFTDADITTAEERRHSPFHQEFLRKHDCANVLLLNVPLPNERTGLLALGRSSTAPEFDEATRQDAERLMFPLRAALRMADELAGLRERSVSLEAHLDSLGMGVFLLGRRGELLHANAAAQRMLHTGGAFTLRQEALTLNCPREAVRFKALLERATALGAGLPGSEAHMRVEQRGRGKRIDITVRPLAHTGWAGTDATALHAVTVVDGASSEDSARVLHVLFGLTGAEAHCALQLRDGRSTGEIATMRGIALPTARAHLQSIFRKTDTHRQGELVSLLNRVLAAHGQGGA